jgi:hypothetical protein
MTPQHYSCVVAECLPIHPRTRIGLRRSIEWGDTVLRNLRRPVPTIRDIHAPDAGADLGFVKGSTNIGSCPFSRHLDHSLLNLPTHAQTSHRN